jgi:hypothetical protein
MADVHEVHTARRGRVWPAVVMLVLVLLLAGIIVAMVMNVRGSISWPAGGIEFGFRPHLYVTRTEGASASLRPITLATDVVPAIAPADSVADPEPVQPAPVPADSDSAAPPEVRPLPVE